MYLWSPRGLLQYSSIWFTSAYSTLQATCPGLDIRGKQSLFFSTDWPIESLQNTSAVAERDLRLVFHLNKPITSASSTHTHTVLRNLHNVSWFSKQNSTTLLQQQISVHIYDKKLIRRWDSERELFTTTSHMYYNALCPDQTVHTA